MQSLGKNNFDFLRFVLATLVIYSHSFPLTQGERLAREPLLEFTGGQLSFGDVAVNCFFIISGLLITLSWARSSSWRDYFLKRALRIYPGFLAVVAICFLIVSPLAGSDRSSHFSTSNVIETGFRALTLRGYVDRSAFADNPYPGAVNGSLWTIRYEFACYALLPLLAVVGMLKRRHLVLCLLVLGIGLQLAMALVDPSPGLGHVGPLFRGWHSAVRCSVFFVCGVAWCLYRPDFLRSGACAILALLAIAAGAFIDHALIIIAPPALTILALWFAFTEKFQLHNFARRGDYSYGIYLYAFPVQQLLVQHFPGLSPTGMFTAALLPTFAMAACSWFIVEKPFLDLKKGHSRRGAQAPLVAEAVAKVP